MAFRNCCALYRRFPGRVRGRIGAVAAAVLLALGGAAVAEEPSPRAGVTGKAVEMVPTVKAPDIAPDGPPINVEKTYYSQFRLLREATHRMAEQRPGVPDLYFVGFAGDAKQDVFLREMKSVRSLFDDRFDTSSRSLALINNRATMETLPLASTHNLVATLNQVARRMDKDEDVLFLFLTTHGNPGVLEVDFPPLGLNNLTAKRLRKMLDDTGIKWRIIVVSACYSGSFIEPLRNESSLVLTAARHDRVSFGCSHENDFTYFGRAYFDQALRGTHSFVDAFEQARVTVHKWETDEELEPSLPQIHVGDAIKPKLARIEARLRRLAPAN